jgi:cytidylate kinase
VAPLPHRIAVIQKRLNLSPKEAARWVEATDRERARFVRDHFDKDPADPHGYDLVLNTGRLSVGGCAEVIEETLHRFRADSQAAPGPRPPTAAEAPTGAR